MESFNGLDGLPATPRQNSPLPIMTRTADGLVWVATSNGIANVDPSRIPRNRQPPPVRVEDLIVDGKRVAGAQPTLRHGVNEVRIDYTALSLSIPERACSSVIRSRTPRPVGTKLARAGRLFTITSGPENIVFGWWHATTMAYGTKPERVSISVWKRHTIKPAGSPGCAFCPERLFSLSYIASVCVNSPPP